MVVSIETYVNSWAWPQDPTNSIFWYNSNGKKS